MAALEEEGLIAQPHTSAGRVPTDAGYRLFVDRLTEIKPLTGAERRAIPTFLDGAADLDDVLHRAVRTLAQLTRNVAVVQYPSLSRVPGPAPGAGPADRARLMLVLITDTGRVEQRVVELPGDRCRDGRVRAAGDPQRRPARSAARRSAGRHRRPAAAVAPELRGLLATLTRCCWRRWSSRTDRIVLGGTANLTENALDFPAIRPVLEALEEQVVLLRLLDQSSRATRSWCASATRRSTRGCCARWCRRLRRPGRRVGAVGVLGPRRMDYGHTMARVAAVARYVGDLIAER